MNDLTGGDGDCGLRAPVARSTTSILVSATTNATLVPSGDQAGSYSSSDVSARTRVVPVATSSRCRYRSCRRQSDEKAMVRPSGLYRGSRWSNGPVVSWVIADPSGRIVQN